MSGSEKKWKKNTNNIFSIKIVTKITNFWTFHVVVVQNNGKENVQKKYAARAKLLSC